MSKMVFRYGQPEALPPPQHILADTPTHSQLQKEEAPYLDFSQSGGNGGIHGSQQESCVASWYGFFPALIRTASESKTTGRQPSFPTLAVYDIPMTVSCCSWNNSR